MMKKAPLIQWWSVAKGYGDDLSYYKKSKKIARIIQVIYIVFGILITAAVIVFFGILIIAVIQLLS
jgi:hypothetical protein